MEHSYASWLKLKFIPETMLNLQTGPLGVSGGLVIRQRDFLDTMVFSGLQAIVP